MKFKTPYAILLGLSMLFASSYSFAADNVCVINNSSKDITANSQRTNSIFDTFFESVGDYSLGANSGDDNKCWAFAYADIDKSYYWIEFKYFIANEPHSVYVGFINPSIGEGYFVAPVHDGIENPVKWEPNTPFCLDGDGIGGAICLQHTGKTDVWRLYIDDSATVTDVVKQICDEDPSLCSKSE